MADESHTTDPREGCNQGCEPDDRNCVCRILSMTDEEIIAEAEADGIDIHAEAEKCRLMFEEVARRLGVSAT